MLRSRFAPWLVAVPAFFFLILAIPWPWTEARDTRGAHAGVAATPTADPASKAATVAGPAPTAQALLGAMTYDSGRGAYVAPTHDGEATLTLDPRVQAHMEKFLAAGRVPWGSAVLIEPKTGRVIAMAEHSQAEPGARGISLRALAPAASVFKIVTSAALLQQGVTPSSEVCFHGGMHRLQPALLRDDPRRDRKCVSLTEALGHSTNVVFAKLASRGLSSEALRAEASRFMFNTDIPFAWRVEPSRAEIPESGFDLAQTAAGFGPVWMSPLHAALIGSIVANGGTFVPPHIVEGAGAATAQQQVVPPQIAAELARMMRTTVTEGTARKAFGRDFRSPRSPLHGIEVAGKTGSLSDADPFRDYSWFVGFAPVDNPQVAIATVVVNERLWHVRASQVAREALAAYFSEHRPELKGSRTARR